MLPEAAEGNGWSLLIDTNLAADAPVESFPVGGAYDVTAHSLLLFLMETAS